jgi:hypothetical protein
MKFCKDCKHAERDALGVMMYTPRCLHPSHARLDPVTGVTENKMFCENERRDYGASTCCGPSGKLWEAAE